MIHSLVEDNKGIIGNYIIDKEKNRIYVIYLDGSEKVLDFTEENIESLTTTMINQAIKIINQRSNPEYISSKRGEMFRDSIFAMCGAGAIFTAIELALKDPNPVRISIEAVAIMALVPVGSFIYENKINKEVDNEYRKYRMYINNYKTFNDNKNDIMLYEGVEYKDAIDINTLDRYSYKDLVKMFNNLGNITSFQRQRKNKKMNNN